MPKRKTPPCTNAIRLSNNTVAYVCNDSVIVKQGGTPAWRYNNPGNITSQGPFAKNHGAIAKADGLAIFPDAETAKKAQEILLRDNRFSFSNRTLRKAIENYAPKGHGQNNPEKYIEYIKQKTYGIGENTKLKDLTDSGFKGLIDAIRNYENSRPGKTFGSPIRKRSSRTGVLKGNSSSGATLRRDSGDYRKVWRIEPNGSTRGYFICGD